MENNNDFFNEELNNTDTSLEMKEVKRVCNM